MPFGSSYICEICGFSYSTREFAEQCEKRSELEKPDVAIGDVVTITRVWDEMAHTGRWRVAGFSYAQPDMFYRYHGHELVELRCKKGRDEGAPWDFGELSYAWLTLSWKEFVLLRTGDIPKICAELGLKPPKEPKVSWWQKVKNFFN